MAREASARRTPRGQAHAHTLCGAMAKKQPVATGGTILLDCRCRRCLALRLQYRGRIMAVALGREPPYPRCGTFTKVDANFPQRTPKRRSTLEKPDSAPERGRAEHIRLMIGPPVSTLPRIHASILFGFNLPLHFKRLILSHLAPQNNVLCSCRRKSIVKRLCPKRVACYQDLLPRSLSSIG